LGHAARFLLCAKSCQAASGAASLLCRYDAEATGIGFGKHVRCRAAPWRRHDICPTKATHERIMHHRAERKFAPHSLIFEKIGRLAFSASTEERAAREEVPEKTRQGHMLHSA
jgi:hypothetical protein